MTNDPNNNKPKTKETTLEDVLRSFEERDAEYASRNYYKAPTLANASAEIFGDAIASDSDNSEWDNNYLTEYTSYTPEQANSILEEEASQALSTTNDEDTDSDSVYVDEDEDIPESWKEQIAQDQQRAQQLPEILPPDVRKQYLAQTENIDADMIANKIAAMDETERLRKEAEIYSAQVRRTRPDTISASQVSIDPEEFKQSQHRIVVDPAGNQHVIPHVNEFGMTPYEAAKYAAQNDPDLRREITGLAWHRADIDSPKLPPTNTKIMLRRGGGAVAQHYFGVFAYHSPRGTANFIIDGQSAKLPRRADFWCPIPASLLDG